MSKRSATMFAALASLAIVATPVVQASAQDDATTYQARLTGFGEVPPKLVDGQGKFAGTLSADGQSISWTVNH